MATDGSFWLGSAAVINGQREVESWGGKRGGERRERRKKGDGTHRGRLVARPESGIWTQVAGGAWAPASDRAGAGQGARGLRGWGIGDGGLRMKRMRMRSPRQNPAPSIPLPEETSRTAGPPGAFLWGAWLTPPLPNRIFKRE